MECKLLSFDLADCDFEHQTWDSRMTIIEEELNEWLKEGWQINSVSIMSNYQYIVLLQR